jgi:hypothetical protein
VADEENNGKNEKLQSGGPEQKALSDFKNKPCKTAQQVEFRRITTSKTMITTAGGCTEQLCSV